MTIMKKHSELFNGYMKVFIKKYVPDIHNSFYQNIYNLILDLQMNLLIFICNRKRLLGELAGDTPEKRYQYFNEVLCLRGDILREIEEEFPEIIYRTVTHINKYIKLQEDVRNKFNEDFNLLKSQNFISTDDCNVNESDLMINISGDIHNGKGVCIVAYKEDKVVYKNKSINSNKFINQFLNLVNSSMTEEVVLIPDFLERDGYYWEEYICHKEIKNINEGNEFYINMGRLLCIAYALNISDLHFENLIAFGEIPVLVDVETIWSIGAYPLSAKEDSTRILVEKNYDSILNTGLLPISSLNKSFGGDTSGILGGKFIGEVRDIVNLYRDDIHIERRKIEKETFDHLPFIKTKEGNIYLKASEYLESIFLGFDEIGQILITKRSEFIDLIRSYEDEIDVRILFRNTKEYGIIKSLLLSPIYSKKEDILFGKISEKLDFFSHEQLSLSEEKQLLNLDIPYFSVKATDSWVTVDDKKIWELPKSPIQKVLDKFLKLNDELLNEQKSLIKFSIQASQLLFSNQLKQKFSLFSNYSVNNEIVEEGLEVLVRDILNKKVVSEFDESVNWLNLTVRDFDDLELEPMNYSIYNGISGLALSLIECYDLLKDEHLRIQVKETIVRIYNTLKNAYNSYEENYSLFLGKLGMLLTMRSIENFLNITHTLKFTKEVKEICNLLCQHNCTDLLDGIAGAVDFIFCNPELIKETKPELLQMKDILLNTVRHNDEGSTFWDKSDRPNVSLAHGNLGIEIALLELYVIFRDSKIKKVFSKAIAFDISRKLNQGWLDIRNNSHSANWCHGSTGVLISRLKFLRIHQHSSCLSESECNTFIEDIKHAIYDIKNIGIDMTNFTLCHGTSGNLLALSYYIREDISIDLNNDINQAFLLNKFCKLNSFGLELGWMCGHGTNYESLGLFTGIAGIIMANSKYIKSATISNSNLIGI